MRILLYFVLVLAMSLHIAYADMTGKEIMQKQKDRHELKYEQATIDMILKDAKGRFKNRTITNCIYKDETGLSKVMIKFLSPADIKNVGLLTWEQGAENEDDQWLYLPASKKVKRISSGGKKNKFMGTDYAYEDLRPENLIVHSYELKGNQIIEDHDCYVVEAVPSTVKEKKDSGYSKRVLYIRKDILLTIKSEYYNKKGKKFKALIIEKVETVKDDIMRINKSIMENLKSGHLTTWITIKRDITTELDENFFSQRVLKKKLP